MSIGWLWIVVAIFATHATGIAALGTSHAGATLSNLSQLAASLFAASACLWQGRRSRPGPSRLWMLAGASFLSWAAAQALWTLNEFSGGATPLLPTGQVLYFFAFAPLAAAALTDEAHTLRSDWLQILDLAQVCVVLLVTYFFLFGVPELWPNHQITAEMFYLAMNLRNVLLCAAFSLKARSPNRSQNRLYAAFAGFLLVYTVANSISGYALIYWHTQSGTWFDFAWSLPFLMLGVVALSWKQDPAQSQPVADLAFWELIRVNVLPLALPLLVLAMAARIALARLPAAILAVMLSIMCYGIRTFVVQCRQARATMRLTQSEHRFESLFQRHPQPMWVFDPKTLRFLEVNLAAIEKYGYSRDEFLKMTVLDIRPEEDASQFMSLSLDFDQPLRLRSWRHKVRSGRVIHVEVTAQKVRFTERSALLVIALDITQKMELEEQLRQSQKMEAVGTLAGGVAHDFNNLLTVIKGYSSLLISSMPTDSDERRQLLEIDRAAERAAGLTRQLLAFSRRQILKAELLDINTLIVNVSRMLERLIGEDIRVITDLEPGLGMVKADPAQLDQVLLNLAVNARDAMPQGGELRFVTNNVPAREIGDREHLHLEAEQYVMLRVSDTGCGMDADLKAHIFEPFFTTKSPGKGTGLGLSTVYGIVKQSGGHIRVDSAPGKGTSFTIYIPLVPGKAAAPTSSEMPDAGLRPARRTVVLVEDETSLRRYAARVLREHGYRVFDAADAEDAMQIFRKADETIDLLLTDVVMPGMNGHVLANEVRLLWPATKVLYMTGYTEETVLRNGVKDSEIELLQKPFPPAVLLRRVAAVLEEEATSASS